MPVDMVMIVIKILDEESRIVSRIYDSQVVDMTGDSTVFSQSYFPQTQPYKSRYASGGQRTDGEKRRAGSGGRGAERRGWSRREGIVGEGYGGEQWKGV